MTTVLVIDDEPQILRALRINLRVREYDVHTAGNGSEALELAARALVKLIAGKAKAEVRALCCKK